MGFLYEKHNIIPDIAILIPVWLVVPPPPQLPGSQKKNCVVSDCIGVDNTSTTSNRFYVIFEGAPGYRIRFWCPIPLKRGSALYLHMLSTICCGRGVTRHVWAHTSFHGLSSSLERYSTGCSSAETYSANNSSAENSSTVGSSTKFLNWELFN